MERELKELKSKQSGDQTIKELLRRNKALKEELIRLKEIMGAPMASLSSHEAPLTARQPLCPDKLSTSAVCNGNLSTGNDAIPSPAPFSRDYNILYDYNQQYIPLSNNCGHLASTISCIIPSNISTPSLPDGYSAGHIQTSMPNSVLPFHNTSSSSIYTIYNKDVVNIEYIEVGHDSAILQTLHQSDIRYGE